MEVSSFCNFHPYLKTICVVLVMNAIVGNGTTFLLLHTSNNHGLSHAFKTFRHIQNGRHNWNLNTDVPRKSPDVCEKTAKSAELRRHASGQVPSPAEGNSETPRKSL